MPRRCHLFITLGCLCLCGCALLLIFPRPQVTTVSEGNLPSRPPATSLTASPAALFQAYQRATSPAEKQALIPILASPRNRSISGQLIDLLALEKDGAIADSLQWQLANMADETIVRQIAAKYENVAGPFGGHRLATVVERIRADELAGLLATFIEAPLPMEDMLAKAALTALRKTGSPFAAAALARRLDVTTSGSDREYLELSLAGIRRPGTQHSLIAIATGRQDATQVWTRLAALEALSHYHDPESRAALQQLAEGSDPQVARAARRLVDGE